MVTSWTANVVQLGNWLPDCATLIFAHSLFLQVVQRGNAR